MCGGCRAAEPKKCWHWFACGYVSYPKKDDIENEPDYISGNSSAARYAEETRKTRVEKLQAGTKCWSCLCASRIWFIFVFCVCILGGLISFIGNGSGHDQEIM